MRLRQIIYIGGGVILLCLSSGQAGACLSAVRVLDVPLQEWRTMLERERLDGDASENWDALLNPYLTAAEQCYTNDVGATALVAATKRADAYRAKLLRFRETIQENVRDNEEDYAALLGSELWKRVETVRVATAYAVAWVALAQSSQEVSAQLRAQGLVQARDKMRALTVEFLHPRLLQRAMFGLAVAHVEMGVVAEAQAVLERLQTSLDATEQAGFLRIVRGYLARISAPDFVPPTVPNTPDAPASKTVDRVAGDPAKIALARNLIRGGAPPSRVLEVLHPLLDAHDATTRAALALIFDDPSLRDAATRPPMASMRAIEKAFAAAQYGRVVAAFEEMQEWEAFLPPRHRHEVNYQIGVAQLSLGKAQQAEAHFRTVLDGIDETLGAEARKQVEPLLHLAILSRDEDPSPQAYALAQRYGAKGTIPTRDQIAYFLALRARVVLARAATSREDWRAADKHLADIAPTMQGYRWVLGMRVRIAGARLRSLKSANKTAAMNRVARQVGALYRLWKRNPCAVPCNRNGDRAVHKVFLIAAMAGDLSVRDFGVAWANFENEGGNILPLVSDALAYLTRQKDKARLIALLETADSEQASQIRARWQGYLGTALDKPRRFPHYDFLTTLAPQLQGETRGDLLEMLAQYAFLHHSAAVALAHTDMLAQDFPRRPSAWFLRAEALSRNGRGVEAARALSLLVRRTPPSNPIGHAARIGMGAVFVDMGRDVQACQIARRVESRPEAKTQWKKAVARFPYVAPWQEKLAKLCPSFTINAENAEHR